MPYVELCLIIALVALLIGLILGIFLGARLTRSHYLYMAGMKQRQPLPKSSPRRTRHLRRDEELYS